MPQKHCHETWETALPISTLQQRTNNFPSAYCSSPAVKRGYSTFPANTDIVRTNSKYGWFQVTSHAHCEWCSSPHGEHRTCHAKLSQQEKSPGRLSAHQPQGSHVERSVTCLKLISKWLFHSYTDTAHEGLDYGDIAGEYVHSHTWGMTFHPNLYGKHLMAFEYLYWFSSVNVTATTDLDCWWILNLCSNGRI